MLIRFSTVAEKADGAHENHYGTQCGVHGDACSGGVYLQHLAVRTFLGPGGMFPAGSSDINEVAADRVKACAGDELGAEVRFDPVPIIVSETIRSQKDRAPFISLWYGCKLLAPPDERRRANLDAPRHGESMA